MYDIIEFDRNNSIKLHTMRHDVMVDLLINEL